MDSQRNHAVAGVSLALRAYVRVCDAICSWQEGRISGSSHSSLERTLSTAEQTGWFERCRCSRTLRDETCSRGGLCYADSLQPRIATAQCPLALQTMPLPPVSNFLLKRR